MKFLDKIAENLARDGEDLAFALTVIFMAALVYATSLYKKAVKTGSEYGPITFCIDVFHGCFSGLVMGLLTKAFGFGEYYIYAMCGFGGYMGVVYMNEAYDILKDRARNFFK